MVSEAERISPEKAIEILKRDGVEVTLEEAKIILDFLYGMAEIVVEQHLKKAS
ncbi:MAG: hypothetical protein J0H85_00680 [Sediminibacterium magnilacihabitans]|jgi:hypothetical protein|nr:hypothetical protein [Sediminibacterium magnilacihabitans]PQV61522.1 hypothetical protein CLV53_102134 [Sediminibacterium magnilacihabitans]